MFHGKSWVPATTGFDPSADVEGIDDPPGRGPRSRKDARNTPTRVCMIGATEREIEMPRMNKIAGGVLVMVAFAVLGQGCCGRRRAPRDAASLSHPGPSAPSAPATTTTN